MYSIITPVWNRSTSLEKAIQSVLSQTFTDYELIIVDDGSEDNLEAVLDPYLSKHITLHKMPHRGVSAARNYGIKQANGDFIAYLDSDNMWHPEFLSVMNNALSSNDKKVAYCMFNVYRRYALNGKLYLHRTCGESFNLQKLLRGNYIDMNTVVHSRECIDDAGSFDEGLKRLVDWDLIIRVTMKYNPVFVPLVLVDYYEQVADNAITNIEDQNVAFGIIRKRYDQYDTHQPQHNSIVINHDGIDYIYCNVDDRKYHNWLEMNDPQVNTTDFAAKGFPYMLQIEPTNSCNLSCPLCPVGRKELTRPTRNMTLEEFRAIIDDMGQYLLFLVLWDWGEPFMNLELPEMIRYASARGIQTVTSTNASFLQNEEYVGAILRSGLSTLIVAVDSLVKENYLVYRRQGDLDDAVSGLSKVLSLKRTLNSPTRINLRMVVMKQNEHELQAIREFAKHSKVDVFTVKTLNPSVGVLHMDQEFVPDNLRYRRYRYKEGTYERVRRNADCTRVWHMSNIFSNGDVVPCCYDYNSDLKVGNIHEQPFSHIWNSAAYRALRQRIYYHKNDIPHCRECVINFELIYGNWMYEIDHFNSDPSSDKRVALLEETIETMKQDLWKRDETIRHMNQSISLRVARRIPFGAQIRKLLISKNSDTD